MCRNLIHLVDVTAESADTSHRCVHPPAHPPTTHPHATRALAPTPAQHRLLELGSAHRQSCRGGVEGTEVVVGEGTTRNGMEVALASVDRVEESPLCVASKTSLLMEKSSSRGSSSRGRRSTGSRRTPHVSLWCMCACMRALTRMCVCVSECVCVRVHRLHLAHTLLTVRTTESTCFPRSLALCSEEPSRRSVQLSSCRLCKRLDCGDRVGFCRRTRAGRHAVRKVSTHPPHPHVDHHHHCAITTTTTIITTSRENSRHLNTTHCLQRPRSHTVDRPDHAPQSFIVARHPHAHVCLFCQDRGGDHCLDQTQGGQLVRTRVNVALWRHGRCRARRSTRCAAADHPAECGRPCKRLV
jgi:hypothetical protein